jgi:hypothetical protein
MHKFQAMTWFLAMGVACVSGVANSACLDLTDALFAKKALTAEPFEADLVSKPWLGIRCDQEPDHPQCLQTYALINSQLKGDAKVLKEHHLIRAELMIADALRALDIKHAQISGSGHDLEILAKGPHFLNQIVAQAQKADSSIRVKIAFGVQVPGRRFGPHAVWDEASRSLYVSPQGFLALDYKGNEVAYTAGTGLELLSWLHFVRLGATTQVSADARELVARIELLKLEVIRRSKNVNEVVDRQHPLNDFLVHQALTDPGVAGRYKDLSRWAGAAPVLNSLKGIQDEVAAWIRLSTQCAYADRATPDGLKQFELNTQKLLKELNDIKTAYLNSVLNL